MKATSFLSARMPETQCRRVKVLAARLGLSLQEVVRQALDAWVLEHDPQARRRERQAGTPAVADVHLPRPKAATMAVADGQQRKRQANQAPGVRRTPQVAAPGHVSAELGPPARSAGVSGWDWLRGAPRLDWSQCPVVKVRATNVGRVWVFRGTRVPLPAVLRDFMDGHSLREVLARHEGLSAEQVKAALQFAVQGLAPSAAPR